MKKLLLILLTWCYLPSISGQTVYDVIKIGSDTVLVSSNDQPMESLGQIIVAKDVTATHAQILHTWKYGSCVLSTENITEFKWAGLMRKDMIKVRSIKANAGTSWNAHKLAPLAQPISTPSSEDNGLNDIPWRVHWWYAIALISFVIGVYYAYAPRMVIQMRNRRKLLWFIAKLCALSLVGCILTLAHVHLMMVFMIGLCLLYLLSNGQRSGLIIGRPLILLSTSLSYFSYMAFNPIPSISVKSFHKTTPLYIGISITVIIIVYYIVMQTQWQRNKRKVH